MAGKTSSGPSSGVHRQKQPQPPDDGEIVTGVRQLEFYITEHVREYYVYNRDGDPDGIFGFEPLKGLGVEMAIRRYISLQALDLLDLDEYGRPDINSTLQKIHSALANYRPSNTDDDKCKPHLYLVLQHAVNLEKLLRLSPSDWNFGSFELNRSIYMDVATFPSFRKGENLIAPEVCGKVRVQLNGDATWDPKKNSIRARVARAARATIRNILQPWRRSESQTPPPPYGHPQRSPAPYPAPPEEQLIHGLPPKVFWAAMTRRYRQES